MRPTQFQKMRANRSRRPARRRAVLDAIDRAELEDLREYMATERDRMERAYMPTLPDSTDPYAAVMNGREPRSTGATWAHNTPGGMLLSQELRNKLTRAFLDGPQQPPPRRWWERLMFWRYG